MKSIFVFFPFLCLFWFCQAALGQQAVYYRVSFPNAVHHEAEVTANFTGLSDAPLRVRMSRSSPGRYATHEFGKNIYNLKATDAAGNYLVVHRLEPDVWEIPRHGATVNVLYTLFGDLVDGTYTAIDEAHAHLNMPASFLWAKGLEAAPVSVTFDVPPGSQWRVATQLRPTNDPATFAAPHLQYFMDSPTELSRFSLREWPVANPDSLARPAGGRPLTIRLAVHHDGTEADMDQYVPLVKQVVAEARGVFGEWPAFDFGTYTFIQDVFPGNDGDGMEHRNSTFITDDATFKGDKLALLGTVSHEFFHCWNVERIRPQALEPFDFEKANMSGELWFAEGFTNYYGELVLRRTGLYDDDRYAASLTSQVSHVLASPGTYRFSPQEMSRQAPFVDASAYVDPVNFTNTYTSYYPYGCTVALALDLTLRTRFKTLTLDDYMKAVWLAHGKPEKPYRMADLQAVLGQVTRDTAFAGTFFRRHITGHEVPDFAGLLARAGLLLRKAQPGAAYLERNLAPGQMGLTVQAGTRIGTPLYEAGLDRGDVIVSVGGAAVGTAAALAEVLARHKPGQTVSVQFVRRGQTRTASVTLSENPLLEIVTFERAGRKPGKEALALRGNWLKSKAL